jgi:Protein of unknown function with HXXEE motif
MAMNSQSGPPSSERKRAPSGALLGPPTGGLFLGLAISQAAHSLEEFNFRLFEVLAPARYLSGLVSDDLASGFAVINTLIVALAFWTYFFRVRPAAAGAVGWIWAWALLELGNGIGHVLFAVSAAGYFPGVYTAPLLLVFSLALIFRLLRPAVHAAAP